jgi:hypothetical protein
MDTCSQSNTRHKQGKHLYFCRHSQSCSYLSRTISLQLWPQGSLRLPTDRKLPARILIIYTTSSEVAWEAWLYRFNCSTKCLTVSREPHFCVSKNHKLCEVHIMTKNGQINW